MRLKQIIAEQNQKIRDYEHKASTFSEINIADSEIQESLSIPHRIVSYKKEIQLNSPHMSK